MINAAVVGLGWWGQNILKNLLNSAVIKPVLGIDPLDQARTSAAALGVETAPHFEDAPANPNINAVILCTPQERHAEQIVAAARAGRHVFCEKPLCTTAADAEAALAAVQKAGVQLGIGHERRFEPAVIEMRKRFTAGEFGNPLLLEGNFSQDLFLKLPSDNWRLSKIGESGRSAFGHRHSHGRSFDRVSGTAKQCVGTAGAIGQRFRERRYDVDHARVCERCHRDPGRGAGDAVHGAARAIGIEGLDGNSRPQPSAKLNRMGRDQRAPG